MTTHQVEIGDFIVIGDNRYKVGHIPADPTFAPVPIVCDACGRDYPGDGLESPGGVFVCGTCVERALVVRYVNDILEDIDTHAPEIARALSFLDEDDACGRASGVQHIDSLSSARDMMATNRMSDLRDQLEVIIDVCARVQHIEHDDH